MDKVKPARSAEVVLHQPITWEEAIAIKSEYPEAVPIAGGTDLLVEINFGRLHPATILDLSRIADLKDHWVEGGTVRIGAGVTFGSIVRDLHRVLPGLAMAARTVGSPQIRNRATLGGNLGTASPAGDSLPPLLASGAEIEVASVRGTRRLAVPQFVVGPKRNALAPDELIHAVYVPAPRGPQQFAKVGTRNAVVIAIASFALHLNVDARRVRTGIGSAGPTPLQAAVAADFIEKVLDDRDLWHAPNALPHSALVEFGRLAAAATRPIDDIRGSAEYRRHAVAVIARRTLDWAWTEYLRSA